MTFTKQDVHRIAVLLLIEDEARKLLAPIREHFGVADLQPQPIQSVEERPVGLSEVRLLRNALGSVRQKPVDEFAVQRVAFQNSR